MMMTRSVPVYWTVKTGAWTRAKITNTFTFTFAIIMSIARRLSVVYVVYLSSVTFVHPT